MFIHIGNKISLSDKKIIGIFNCDSLRESDANSWITGKINDDDKLVVVDIDNNVIASTVSPFTVLKRVSLNDFIWRRDNG